MAKAIHAMIRVLDLDKSIAFYDRALGLEVADRFEFDDFTLVYLRNDESDFEIELTWNRGRTSPTPMVRATAISPSASTTAMPSTGASRSWVSSPTM